jgi:hypothetical protein
MEPFRQSGEALQVNRLPRRQKDDAAHRPICFQKVYLLTLCANYNTSHFVWIELSKFVHKFFFFPLSCAGCGEIHFPFPVRDAIRRDAPNRAAEAAKLTFVRILLDRT